MKRFSLALASAGLLLTGLVSLPSAPAAATHPTPSEDQGTEIALTEADHGQTVTLVVGQRLRVDLGAPAGGVWADVDAGSSLHRYRIVVDPQLTTARFTAWSPTPGEDVLATTDMACFHEQPACASPTRQWRVTVVVLERSSPSPSASPAPSPSSTPCPVTQIAPAPGTVVADESSDGRTIRVPEGDRLLVAFTGCTERADYQPAEGGGPLYREYVDGTNPGSARSTFLAVSPGTTEVTAVRDAPCLHMRDNGCAITAQVWQITVEVVPAQPCALTGTAEVAAGSSARLAGQVAPGATVRIWFRPYAGASFVVRRVLTADSAGAFRATFTPAVDHRWYATSDECTTPGGLTRVTPVVTASAVVPRGATVPVTVRGFPGQEVRLYALRAGGTYRVVRTARLDGSGTYRTSYLADVDHRFYALTGPDGRRSAGVLVQTR